MLLGSAENINTKERLFTAIDAKLQYYKRSGAQVDVDKQDFPSAFSYSTKQFQKDISPAKVPVNIQTFADQLVLQQFAPASVLINQEGDILYITGRTGKYLEPSAGKANMNIYAMARDGLLNELSGAIRKAKQSFEPIYLPKIKIGNNGGTLFVNVTIQAIEKPDAFKGNIMIIFADVKDQAKIAKIAKVKLKTEIQTLSIPEQESQIELQRTLEELQSIREEMQTSQEELKSTNEELQSTNEELQSTNEELTTSKEEMQSLNEELQTVNSELQNKVSDYVEANNDMKNLLNSTDIATLFLDRELNIRRFTDQLTKIIKLRPTDIGRPFTDMVSDLKYPEIADQALDVLRTLVFKESEISSNDDRWFTVRIMPYRTLDDKIDGLVITFIDITASKKTEAKLVAANIVIANKELALQNKEKQKSAVPLVVPTKNLHLKTKKRKEEK